VAMRILDWDLYMMNMLDLLYRYASLSDGVRSEKCVVGRCRRHANIVECTYTNLDSIAYYTVGYMVLHIAPRLKTCTACNCTEYCRQL